MRKLKCTAVQVAKVAPTTEASAAPLPRPFVGVQVHDIFVGFHET